MVMKLIYSLYKHKVTIVLIPPGHDDGYDTAVE